MSKLVQTLVTFLDRPKVLIGYSLATAVAKTHIQHRNFSSYLCLVYWGFGLLAECECDGMFANVSDQRSKLI